MLQVLLFFFFFDKLQYIKEKKKTRNKGDNLPYKEPTKRGEDYPY